jgi:hypothetical protein
MAYINRGNIASTISRQEATREALAGTLEGIFGLVQNKINNKAMSAEKQKMWERKLKLIQSKRDFESNESLKKRKFQASESQKERDLRWNIANLQKGGKGSGSIGFDTKIYSDAMSRAMKDIPAFEPYLREIAKKDIKGWDGLQQDAKDEWRKENYLRYKKQWIKEISDNLARSKTFFSIPEYRKAYGDSIGIVLNELSDPTLYMSLKQDNAKMGEDYISPLDTVLGYGMAFSDGIGKSNYQSLLSAIKESENVSKTIEQMVDPAQKAVAINKNASIADNISNLAKGIASGAISRLSSVKNVAMGDYSNDQKKLFSKYILNTRGKSKSKISDLRKAFFVEAGKSLPDKEIETAWNKILKGSVPTKEGSLGKSIKSTSPLEAAGMIGGGVVGNMLMPVVGGASGAVIGGQLLNKAEDILEGWGWIGDKDKKKALENRGKQ